MASAPDNLHDLVEQWAGLINKDLNEITKKISPDTDIVVAQEALRSLTEPDKNHKVAENLEEHVFSLKKLIDEPSKFVTTPTQAGQLKKLALALVDRKLRDIAIKIELVDNYLNNIPVKTDVDFSIVKEALRSITNPQASHTVAENLKEHIQAIKELIDDPSMYVQEAEHYGEFKSCVLSRVAARIKKLEVLKPEEKEEIIKEKEEFQEIKAQQKETRAGRTAPKPGSEAHTITEEEMHREWQEQAQREGQRPARRVQNLAQSIQVGAGAPDGLYVQMAGQQGADAPFTRLVNQVGTTAIRALVANFQAMPQSLAQRTINFTSFNLTQDQLLAIERTAASARNPATAIALAASIPDNQQQPPQTDAQQTSEVEETEVEVQREVQIEQEMEIERQPVSRFRPPVANPNLIESYRTVISILPDDRTTPLNSDERNSLRIITDDLNSRYQIIWAEEIRRIRFNVDISREEEVHTRLMEIQDFRRNINLRMRELSPRVEAETALNTQQEVNFPPPPPPSAPGALPGSEDLYD